MEYFKKFKLSNKQIVFRFKIEVKGFKLIIKILLFQFTIERFSNINQKTFKIAFAIAIF